MIAITLESRIRELIDRTIADNHRPNVVQFASELLLLIPEAGVMRCWQIDSCKLGFQIGNQPAWEIELGRARTKLRMLCARLGVICMERTGKDINIYGDEALLETDIPHDQQPQTECRTAKWHIRFKNNNAEPVGFVIETV